jgi:DNA (cytosine-5)-methyltransferase 1
MGYHLAGLFPVGIDHKPQGKYPFPFILGDCFEVLSRMLLGDRFRASDGRFYGMSDFSSIHASPPCQSFTTASRAGNTRERHPNLIPQTRELLRRSGLPYVIENVPGARRHLIEPFMLCGTMFGLRAPCGAELWRHRYFETNWHIGFLPACDHRSKRVITITGATAQRNIGRNKAFETFPVTSARAAMGMDWVGMEHLSQAIPPAYTELIGRQLMREIMEAVDPCRGGE